MGSEMCIRDRHPKLVDYFEKQAARVTRCDSFLHLHVGIDATGLPTEPSESLPAQWAALDDWDRGVDAPRNLVLVSMASMLDPSFAARKSTRPSSSCRVDGVGVDARIPAQVARAGGLPRHPRLRAGNGAF